eukprot:849950-Pleurochrysis_carterae.AAC.2
MADHIHKRIRYQLACYSERLLMPHTCAPPIHTTALSTIDLWATFKRTIMEVRAGVGEHGLDTVMLIAELDVNAAMVCTPSHADTPITLIKLEKHAFEDGAPAQCGGDKRIPASATLVLREEADEGVRRALPLHDKEIFVKVRLVHPGAQGHRSFTKLVIAIERYLPTISPAAVPAPAPTPAPARRV